MTKIYEVKMTHRWTGATQIEYYMNKTNAEKRVAEINKVFEDAKQKGAGIHWQNVTYNRAWVNIIETRD